MRNIRLHRAGKRDKYAKELPKYLVGTQVWLEISQGNLWRRSLLVDSVLPGYCQITHELQKPNGRMFKVNVHHIMPYGTGKGRKTKQPANTLGPT